MVGEDTMVMMTCLATSNTQSNISWEQVTANNRTDRMLMKISMDLVHSVVLLAMILE